MDRTKTSHEEHSKTFGVLFTGYLDKRNPVTGSYKKRFAVLTRDAYHWFQRAEGYDLFGEERGQVNLNSVVTVRVLDEDSTTFELHSTDRAKRLFRASTPALCEEWVSITLPHNCFFVVIVY